MASRPESLELLLEVSLLLSSKLDVSELLETIMQLSSRVVNAETASLLLVDPKTNELYFDVALGLAPELSRIRLKMGQGIAGSCAQEGRTLVINDVRKDARWSATMDKTSGFVTRSILAAPMKIKGRTIGVVEAINKIEGGFSDDDIRVFEAFASQAAVAVENARLFASVIEEKARLDTMFSQMTDAALLIDGRGAVLIANGSASRHLGAALEGASHLERAFGGFAVTPSIPELLASSQPSVRFEAVRERPKELILAGAASVIRFEQLGRQPASTGRLILFRDVTAERHEDALKRSFLSLISHKLKTPLASITGYSQLLVEDLQSEGSKEIVGRSVSAILAQGNKLSSLVDKLLNYTVLEELRDSDIARDAVSVDELAAEALASLKGWLDDQKGSVQVRPAPGLLIDGDRLLLRDVIKNLIENGVKFSTGDKSVELWAEPQGGQVAVHVRDRGPGIPPEEQGKIFDRFYQVEASFTGQVEGWGLGLPFVKKVVESHGGRVRLDSSLGSGTTVTVWLPAGTAARLADGAAA
ncbi:MAG: GAF domain-containing protein [Elusimicrobia bacterium]|nr:GAF domain-containing protein [Elusimicrobiota bacterium]